MEQKQRSDIYILNLGGHTIDAMFYRSAAAMANNAFPNAAFEALKYNPQSDRSSQVIQGVDGLFDRSFIVATDDIAEGEQITLDYGHFSPA